MRAALLRQHDLRLLWTGETVTALGTAVTTVALPLVALEVLDASVLAVTVLAAASWLPWLVVGLPAGAWVDRLPKRPVLVVSDLASALLLASVPVAAALDVLSVGQLLVVALGLGTASVFFRTAWTAYVPVVVPADRLVPANALLHGSESAAQVAGPGLAGLLVGLAGAVAALVADLVSFVVSAGCLLRVRAVEPVPQAPTRHLRAEVVEGVRLVTGDRFLRNLVLHGAIANLPLVGYGALVVPFLLREAGQSPAVVGLLIGAASTGGVLGAGLSSRVVRRLGSARALVALKGGAGVCSLLVPLADDGPRVALYVAGAGLVGAGVVAGNVVSTSFRQRYVPAELMGRVMSAMQFANLGTIPLGAVGAGLLAEGLGLRPAVVLLTAAYALSGLVLALGPLRGRRDLPDRLEVRAGRARAAGT